MNMNTLMRWDPIRELESLQNRVFGALAPSSSPAAGSANSADRDHPAWQPVVDVVEDPTEYHISAELPGMEKEDVKVGVENGCLTISGERSAAPEVEGRKYHRMERAWGPFLRTFMMPENCDLAKVEASFSDGVLHIRVAKQEKALPRKIDISVV